MKRAWVIGFLPLLGACGRDDEPVAADGGGGTGGQTSDGGRGEIPNTVPEFDAGNFSDGATVNHPYYPLPVGHTTVYFSQTEEGAETTVVEVLADTREVFGIDTRVVRDLEFVDGLLMEDTRDWFAQDDDGNVWYLGEEVDNYEYDDAGEVVAIDHEGAWEAGKDVAGVGATALPGYLIKATLEPGDTYHQEYYPGQAEDMAEVLELAVDVTLADGWQYTTLKTRDFDPLEEGSNEYKYYAAGIGVVLEEDLQENETLELVGIFQQGAEHVPDFSEAQFASPTEIDNEYLPFEQGTMKTYEAETDEGIETIVIEVLDESREVAGVDCVVVRDRVYLDDVLVEDTHDWFAQDDDGNVWYLGEEVVNYNYDDNGELVDTDTDGSWEAGKDVANIGVTAQPGIVMKASPKVRESYYQEWYPGEADDMGFIVAVGLTVELPDGTEYENCLQTLDWVPLEPEALEYKYYAPGVGLVLERSMGGEEEVALVAD